MESLNIAKFDPIVAEIQVAVEHSKTLALPDPKDKEQVKRIKDQRLLLRSLRTGITKAGKEMREDAISFQKAVIAKEKEYVALVEPEETRLEVLEAEAKRIQDREDRREFLPRRKERLAAIGDGIEATDDQLLDMDGTEFEGYFNKRQADQNEKVRKENEAAAAELRKKEEDQKRKEQAEDEKKRKAEKEKENRKLERAKRLLVKGYKPTEAGMQPPALPEGLPAFSAQEIEEDAPEVFEKKYDGVVVAIENYDQAVFKAEQERLAAEKRSRDQKYQDFLASHGYNEQDFYTVQGVSGKVTLYKKVGEYDPNA